MEYTPRRKLTREFKLEAVRQPASSEKPKAQLARELGVRVGHALLRRSTWYRRSHAQDQTPLRMRIRELALNRPRFGYLRIHVLLRREGWLINRKRVHRLYRLDGLQVRITVRMRNDRPSSS